VGCAGLLQRKIKEKILMVEGQNYPRDQMVLFPTYPSYHPPLPSLGLRHFTPNCEPESKVIKVPEIRPPSYGVSEDCFVVFGVVTRRG